MRCGAVCVSLAGICLTMVSAAPAFNEYSKGLDWLSRYGYLPPPDPRTGKLQTKEGIERALRVMQRFGGIKETGKLDKATMSLMERPRCSLPDIIGTSELLRRRKRYALTGLTWSRTQLTWSVDSYPNRSQSPTLSDRLVDTLIHWALNIWSEVTPLQFNQVSKPGGVGTGVGRQQEPDIRVSFNSSYHQDGYPFDGPGGTLAHAFFPGEHPISGDAHFDDQETWTYGSPDGEGTDLFTVAIHEFGHALGLSHSSSPHSIMAPYYNGSVGDPRKYILPPDDREGIQQLYGKKESRNTKPPKIPPTPSLPKLPSPPPRRPTRYPRPALPDRCVGGFDAIANIRGEVFFFKGQYFWRIQRSGSLVSLNPALISNFWHGLPARFPHIDAVYERTTDSNIIFFIGDQYWVFKDTAALPNYPKPVSDWGVDVGGGGVRAAFVWAHNGKTYLFRGGLFWRHDDREGRIDPGYPKEATLWNGVPPEPDDIITWGDGDAYFFKDNYYWVQKKGGLSEEAAMPRSLAVDWMKCPPPPTTSQPHAVPDPKGRGGCTCDLNNSHNGEVLPLLRGSYWLSLQGVCWLLCLTFC
ncbi:matrix metalloproteinase-25 [Amia ocellicauda]|uniref:matrix metalloproteinase-25 n=1 Tax=Amia ocellicauda TaxID=2972642 RepID=UPI003464BA87